MKDSLLRLLGLKGRPKMKGFYFLRSYKARHRGRLEKVIAEGQLGKDIVITDEAYDEEGNKYENKVGVWCRNDQIHSQTIYYALYNAVKQDEKEEQKRREMMEKLTAGRVSSGGQASMAP